MSSPSPLRKVWSTNCLRLFDEQSADVGRKRRRLGEVWQAFELSPLDVKVGEHSAALCVREHAVSLRPHVSRRVQLSVFRGLRERRIGKAAPEQQGQPRRRFLWRQFHDGSAAGIRLAELDSIEEIWRLQNGADDQLDGHREPVCLPAHVERLIVGDLRIIEGSCGTRALRSCG